MLANRRALQFNLVEPCEYRARSCLSTLSGFTNYTGACGDDAAGRLLSAFRTIVRQVASERGVRIAKWLGDGCMLVSVDQTETIAFTLDLHARSADVCSPLTLRAGIAPFV